MDLYLRKVIHPQAGENCRVILKDEDGEFEIGSIGIQHAAGASYFWAWAIDTVPMRTHQTQGEGKDRRDRAVEQIANDIGMNRQNVDHYVRFRKER